MRSPLLCLGPRHTPRAVWWLGSARHHTQQLQASPLSVWQKVSRRLRDLIMAAAPQSSVSDGSASLIRLAIIGDAHGDWDSAEDGEALQSLGCDAAVFVGDLNNEDIPLVREIAGIVQPPIAVVLGNHDARGCLTTWSTRTPKAMLQPGYDSIYSGVEQQLEILGADHVGYAHKRFMSSSGVPFAIVGARPFSKGGSRWGDCEDFYMRFYEVADADASVKRIAETVMNVPEDTVPILVAHNGPKHLGSNPWSISGVDFRPRAGDHGDPDLELALQQIYAQKRAVPLVAFGHMHEKLRGTTSLRNMVEVNAGTGTVYLNTAVVPRVRIKTIDGCEVEVRHFCIAELQHSMVQRISNVWVSPGRDDQPPISEEQVLLTRGSSTEGDQQLCWYKIWRGYTQEYEVVDIE